MTGSLLVTGHREIEHDRIAVGRDEIGGDPARDKNRIRFPEETDGTEREQVRVSRPEAQAYEHAAPDPTIIYTGSTGLNIRLFPSS